MEGESGVALSVHILAIDLLVQCFFPARGVFNLQFQMILCVVSPKTFVMSSLFFRSYLFASPHTEARGHHALGGLFAPLPSVRASCMVLASSAAGMIIQLDPSSSDSSSLPLRTLTCSLSYRRCSTHM